MNFTLIILIIILIIVIITLSFIFINKLNKRRISQNTDQKRSKDDKTELMNTNDDETESINTNDVYSSFSDQIHSPINLDRSLLEIEEVGKRQLINEDKEQFGDGNNTQIQLIRNSEFIF